MHCFMLPLACYIGSRVDIKVFVTVGANVDGNTLGELILFIFLLIKGGKGHHPMITMQRPI